MAKRSVFGKAIHIPIDKKTSIGGTDSRIKKSSMNKNKRRSYKKYRGQGR